MFAFLCRLNCRAIYCLIAYLHFLESFICQKNIKIKSVKIKCKYAINHNNCELSKDFHKRNKGDNYEKGTKYFFCTPVLLQFSVMYIYALLKHFMYSTSTYISNFHYSFMTALHLLFRNTVRALHFISTQNTIEQLLLNCYM